MRITPRVFGVPLHPLLVHFPIAFWLTAPILDTAALLAGPAPWSGLANFAANIGVVTGAAAIAAGLLDYVHPTLVGIDLKLAARHGVRTTLAWGVFMTRAVIAALSPIAFWSLLACLAFDLVGCTLLIQGIYFGTRQVYQQLEE